MSTRTFFYFIYKIFREQTQAISVSRLSNLTHLSYQTRCLTFAEKLNLFSVEYRLVWRIMGKKQPKVEDPDDPWRLIEPEVKGTPFAGKLENGIKSLLM